MNKNAENNLVKYNEKYNSNKTDEPEDTCINTDDCVSVNESENVNVIDISTNVTGVNKEVSEIVAKMDDLVKLETKPETESLEQDLLEQWLDDILDD